ncbi:MAG: serine/threonine-protein phosphatase [Actinobacteria bacterium]|nr:serine/threonine-protein phosphatase [Actinomycetota bacterium]
MPSDRTADLRALLDAAEAAPPTEGVDALAAELASSFGAVEVGFLIADIVGGTLVRLARAGGDGKPARAREAADTVAIDGTPAGDALRNQEVRSAPAGDGDGVWVFAPVTERGEAVGVLELLLPAEPDDETVGYLASAAHALAYVVIAANAAVIEHASDDQFVTGQLLRVDLATGEVQVANAGHVLPVLVREGASTEIGLEADPAFGIDPTSAYRLQGFSLLPGDRLVLLTDGMLERKAADADVRGLLAEVGALHPREAVQVLTKAVSTVSDELEDDATVLILDWYGGNGERDASAGSTDEKASR